MNDEQLHAHIRVFKYPLQVDDLVRTKTRCADLLRCYLQIHFVYCSRLNNDIMFIGINKREQLK
jgi:hypothetical protein